MALTYAVNTVNYGVTTASVLSTGAQAVAALSAGTLVAAILDGEVSRSRVFIPQAGSPASQWSGSSAAGSVNLYASSGGVAITGGIYNSGTAASVVFPSVVSATVVAGPTGQPSGSLKLVLQPGSGDLFNASSVMTYWLDQEALVVTVSGTL